MIMWVIFQILIFNQVTGNNYIVIYSFSSFIYDRCFFTRCQPCVRESIVWGGEGLGGER